MTGGACRTHGTLQTKFWSVNLKGKNHLECLCLAGRIILKRALKK